jgi:hypothetical protein
METRKKKFNMEHFATYFKCLLKTMFPRIKPKLYFSFSKVYQDDSLYYLSQIDTVDQIDTVENQSIIKQQLLIAYQLSLNHFSNTCLHNSHDEVHHTPLSS